MGGKFQSGLQLQIFSRRREAGSKFMFGGSHIYIPWTMYYVLAHVCVEQFSGKGGGGGGNLTKEGKCPP